MDARCRRKWIQLAAFLWEINHSAPALHENRGPDVQCVLALCWGVGLCAELAGASLMLVLPGKQLTPPKGAGGSGEQGKTGDHRRLQVPSPLEPFPSD